MGFDLGVLLANLIFVFVRTESIPEQYADKDDYQQWLIELIGEVHALFRKKLLLLWDEQAREPVTFYSGFREFYLSSILHDTAGYAGCELCRRVIGIAKVMDIASIEDPIRRSKAERLCLHIGKKLILNRSQMDSENHWLSLLTTAKEDAQ
ncbi:Methylthioribose kinase [compost metagenome]